MFATEGSVNDKLGVVGVIQPQSISAGATGVLTAAIDMKDFERVVFVVQSGTLGTSGTLDITGEASDASAGTYAPLTGKAATQLVKATGDNKVVIVEVTQDDVAKVNKRYVKFRIAAGTAAATSGGVVIGVPASYGKGKDFNLAAVTQTI